MSKLWGGRFEGKTDELVEALSESVSFDARLAPYDVRVSVAHARMLGDRGIISKGEARKIIRGLEAIRNAIESGKFPFDPALEKDAVEVLLQLQYRQAEAEEMVRSAMKKNPKVKEVEELISFIFRNELQPGK